MIGELLMNEKTKVTLNIINFITLILFIVTAVSTASAWKNEVDHNQRDMSFAIEKNTASIEMMNPALVEIQTDLKWIRAALEK